MSRVCQGCGGILGRDCFNEYDCVQISEQHYYDDNNTNTPIMDAIDALLKYKGNFTKLSLDEGTFRDLFFESSQMKSLPIDGNTGGFINSYVLKIGDVYPIEVTSLPYLTTLIQIS